MPIDGTWLDVTFIGSKMFSLLLLPLEETKLRHRPAQMYTGPIELLVPRRHKISPRTPKSRNLQTLCQNNQRQRGKSFVDVSCEFFQQDVITCLLILGKTIQTILLNLQ